MDAVVLQGCRRSFPGHLRGRIFAFDGMLVTLTFGTSTGV